jgi:hypothetical protein
MDVAYPLMVVGCAERKVNIYNLAEPTKLYRVSHLEIDASIFNLDLNRRLLCRYISLACAYIECRVAAEIPDACCSMFPGCRWVRNR